MKGRARFREARRRKHHKAAAERPPEARSECLVSHANETSEDEQRESS